MKTYYFGTCRGLLDPVSLEFRCFGAVWYEEHGHRYVVGYGFGEHRVEILRQFNLSLSLRECADDRTVREIYQEIRTIQQEQDWSGRTRLPLLAAFKQPWREMRPGWYVLRSRQCFPCHVSFVHKTKTSVWLEHAAVCENDQELQACIQRASDAHQIGFTILSNLEGIRNG
ncbi:hypothetical protein ACE6ED_15430 [Paenibacillus sp. CN-4]|uniref:hypothetical protein n=1 Tax=Paenibacillus nanchangensis TaxID=3348343 RepID=UPI00397C39E9